nr:DNA topoisomerase 2 isoform X1 [Tanacetum cinerariifolium]
MVPMKPWYKWFTGDIQKKKKSGYTTRGMIHELELKDKNALEITELPNYEFAYWEEELEGTISRHNQF